MIKTLKDSLSFIVDKNFLLKAGKAGAIIILGMISLKILTNLILRVFGKHMTDQSRMILGKTVKYTGGTLILLLVMSTFGLGTGPLLGAAGVIGIAFGFAAQTSVSNLISGLFLISEKPFEIGDLIKVGETQGVILSIDLLSVKIKTFDNRFIRIPNEKLLNSELTNITRFPIRRMDFVLSVAFKEDLEKVQKIIRELAERNPYCLDEPEPLVLITEFGEYSIKILVGLWFEKNDFIKLKNSIMIEIQKSFREENIEIPFPHRTLYTGSQTASFPIDLSGNASSRSIPSYENKKSWSRRSKLWQK